MIGLAANTKKSLFESLNLDENLGSKWIDAHNAADTRFLKDLKINVGNVLKSEVLSPKEALLMALAVAINEKSAVLTQALEEMARAQEATDEEINEVAACVSLMNANNVFYRFRHFMHKNENYQNMPAGIRMSVMMKPVLGKEFFELLSLGVSALNGCEQCVTSHEASVKSHGGTEARIFDAIRLVSVIKSFVVLL
ncbi:carboxymuconolactone decarboxylase family protein [Marinilongibacter aquaticus]|uniref:carboxymuconolactone decarboxylase family protein n=1 Tax=Marinilongibacter aquaticus TaxID=2975157 RepID=UPI0021BD4EC7|nr:carboxymuconolactone decarboxylase family protein [Marinilongibacter aquaticus]UBM60378.1 carboxymuconolactone decarboxylase family protein [Marinilongibacter aquaticus]